MIRISAAIATGLALAACGHSAYAVRPIPGIVADAVGKPVSRLEDIFGTPRKIDTTSNKLLYVWYLEQRPPGAPLGFHGCELEVSVDSRSERVLGYSSTDLGWSKCSDMQRKVRAAEP